ncbi:FAD-binding and (Fe-S)-binding domain-containing protein [Rhodoglobus aureus]|uniref:FAD-binding and (Fe-S)-binding domain-containing protein n=1 Tax=Rhodoglobus aureus TaxID=191497 RepID=UPI0031CE9A97
MTSPASNVATGKNKHSSSTADVRVSAFERIVASVDASHFILIPDAIVTAQSIGDVAAVFRYAREHRTGVTLRSGGTSLSGQASGSGILLDTRSAFRRITPNADGTRVSVEPGATVRQVNARLLRRKHKLGPDPASEIAATIGGVIANNSSGMACGAHSNSYRTMNSLTFVLPSGTVIDTAAPGADAALAHSEPELHAGLASIQNLLATRDDLRAEIERQYRGKNTMGYGLNSFLDYTAPVDILAHLMVGSEGTLGFVALAEFETVPIAPHIATALVLFETLDAATRALPALVESGAATLELMDAASLRVIQEDPASSDIVPEIKITTQAALLIEFHAKNDAALDDQLVVASLALSAAGAPQMLPTRDPAERARLWHTRKGLYATVAGARRPGTTALLEDIAVPVDALAETCAALQRLFARYGYDDAVIFGHAKDGNIHFLLTEDFSHEAAVQRQHDFTEDLVTLVLATGGTLKAEHGTGRIMAPFVERQFGSELYEIMKTVKRLCDPTGILNPGVLLGSSPSSHLEHLKSTPQVETEVDRCVECGYCEPVCPSKDLTLTPRQRIAVRRARLAARNRGDNALDLELGVAEEYSSIETCAADGMCQTACPVLINTGDLVRRLRQESAPRPHRTIAARVARAWGPITRGASIALSIAKLLPTPAITAVTRIGRNLLGRDTVPLYTSDLPAGGLRRKSATSEEPQAVFFSACVGSMFGSQTNGADSAGGAAAAFRALSARAGIALATPAPIEGLCCGTPWKSKGYADGYTTAITRTVDALVAASDHGRLPIVCDNSSCTEGLMLAVRTRAAELGATALTIVDSVDFVAEQLLPHLTVAAPLESIALHPTCSSTQLGSNPSLMAIAATISPQAIVPDAWGCCGFAGDRGMLHPELTASATADEAAEIALNTYEAYASCNRACEIGMTRATGHDYVHIIELLEKATRPGSSPAEDGNN